MIERKASRAVPKRPKKAPKRRSSAKNRPRRRSPAAILGAKSLALAEPPKDRDPAHLLPAFATKVNAVLATLAAEGMPFKLDEGFRTVGRQQWLYGQGRPTAVPYGRTGAIVTNDDGVNTKSKHQGSGNPGTGEAVDCYPMKNGSIIWPPPPASDPVWKRYADVAQDNGLEAGYYWTTFKDVTHCQMP